MSARETVADPVMAMAMSAAWRARERLNVFILENPLMSWSCRKAACVDPRDQVAWQQTASRRRSDQNSRWMLGRWVTQALRPGFILQVRCTIRSGEERMEDCRQHAREAFGHAGRHEDALVAIDRRLRWTARHVVCHFVGRDGGGHLIRHHLH